MFKPVKYISHDVQLLLHNILHSKTPTDFNQIPFITPNSNIIYHSSFAALLIFMLGLIPCFALHMNVEILLVLIGQNPEVAK